MLHVYTKKFVCGGDNEASGRWCAEPARHLYSMAPGGDKSPMAGERLPAPAVIREPESTWGPDGLGEARGGAVEVEEEFDGPEGADDGWDDYL
ncbi:MAG: hypothetical protein JSR98_05015 [Proteobacteria bacterium]|nr:hypothetical protein [Pseudomonadota bacterium]